MGTTIISMMLIGISQLRPSTLQIPLRIPGWCGGMRGALGIIMIIIISMIIIRIMIITRKYYLIRRWPRAWGAAGRRRATLARKRGRACPYAGQTDAKLIHWPMHKFTDWLVTLSFLSPLSFFLLLIRLLYCCSTIAHALEIQKNRKRNLPRKQAKSNSGPIPLVTPLRLVS